MLGEGFVPVCVAPFEGLGAPGCVVPFCVAAARWLATPPFWFYAFLVGVRRRLAQLCARSRSDSTVTLLSSCFLTDLQTNGRRGRPFALVATRVPLSQLLD